MRRLIIEGSIEDFAKLLGDPTIRSIEFLEVLSFLKGDPDEFAMICRMKFKDPRTPFSQLNMNPGDEVQILDRGKEGVFTFFYKGKPDTTAEARSFLDVGGYLWTPYEIRDGKMKLTFIGTSKQVNSFLSMIRKLGIRCKIRVFSGTQFLPSSPLGKLTDKQREVLVEAFKSGYYDIPRKTDSNKLARKLSIANPTFVMHRRKAERILLEEILKET